MVAVLAVPRRPPAKRVGARVRNSRPWRRLCCTGLWRRSGRTCWWRRRRSRGVRAGSGIRLARGEILVKASSSSSPGAPPSEASRSLNASGACSRGGIRWRWSGTARSAGAISPARTSSWTTKRTRGIGHPRWKAVAAIPSCVKASCRPRRHLWRKAPRRRRPRRPRPRPPAKCNASTWRRPGEAAARRRTTSIERPGAALDRPPSDGSAPSWLRSGTVCFEVHASAAMS
mmetsp:Transcript_16310/g.42011  ORF Transcript_16310/g.42011 Transcript_16310/m.42011 type:complete len:230 (+) Transcript_16310:53-742(+)